MIVSVNLLSFDFQILKKFYKSHNTYLIFLFNSKNCNDTKFNNCDDKTLMGTMIILGKNGKMTK